MRKVLMVARREYKAIVCTKAFILGLVLAPVFMCGGAIVMAIMKSRVDTRERKVVVVDRSARVATAIAEAAEKRNAREIREEATGKQVRPAYAIEIAAPKDDDPGAQRLELSERVRRREIHAFLEIGPAVVHPRGPPEAARIAYYAENPALDDVRRWIAGPVNDELRRLRLADAGIAETAVADLFDWLPVEGFGLLSADAATGKAREAERTGELEAVLLPMVPLMLLFLLVMMGAMPQLQSVTEEKAQRTAEVILGCLRPFEFMMGKLLGGAAVSLTGAAVYVLGGMLVIRHLGYGEFFPYAILPWFLAYLVSATFLYGALLAALGSACNDATEAQSVTFPAMLPLLVPMFLILPVVEQPNGTLATGLSLVPLFTPFVMLLRQGTPAGIPAWQPWVGLVGVAATTVLFVWAGGRVFRVGILMRGTPPRLKNLLRWAIRG